MFGNIKKNTITIIETEKENQGGYRFIIRKSGTSWTAYKTKQGFEAFIKRNKLKLELVEERDSSNNTGWVKVYRCVNSGTIICGLFWDLNNIPEDANKYKNLSNGSYVDCYYWNIGENSYDYRPNPNAKEVYIPLPIKEHIEYSTNNG